MKKIIILALTALLLASFTLPAAAMEYQFGGYWRTRLYTNKSFTGYDVEDVEKRTGTDVTDMDRTRIDTRSRLFFTAVINQNLKFINRFEINAEWGKTGANHVAEYADIGADGTQSFRVKNSYVDFNAGPVNGKIGVQGVVVGRGFVFDDDMPAAILGFTAEGVNIPLMWIKAFDEDNEFNKRDVDFFVLSPSFSAGGMTVNPFGMYVFSDNAMSWTPTKNYDKMKMWYAGLDLAANMGPFAFWALGIYQGGDADLAADKSVSHDFKAWMAAANMKLDLGAADLHAQGFYASGDDSADNDIEHFFVPCGYATGQYYNWSEILGEGIFDAQIPRLANGKSVPGTQTGGNGNTNGIMAGNFGVTVKPMTGLSISLDAWYASLVEDLVLANGNKEKELGIEANVKVTYTLVEGLNIDLVGAYLFAGDAIKASDDNDGADPYEIGTRLSLSF